MVIFVRVLGIQGKQNRDNAIYQRYGRVKRNNLHGAEIPLIYTERAVGVDVFMMYPASVSVLSLRLEVASIQSLSSSHRPESQFPHPLPKCSRSLSLL